MGQAVNVSRGEVFGIGKFKVSQDQHFDYVIPMLSFIVIKESDNSFVSTCIHLRIDGYGKTEKQATDDMIENALFFLHENFTDPRCKDQSWQNLADLFKTDAWSNELWDAYHAVQIELSIQGRETDTVASLRERIGQLEMRVKRLESEESQQVAKELAAMWKNLSMNYTPIAEAAA
ncbi:hypothetical protein AGMMS50268_31660 [Spirochaetia bacterium]|nr:hypothetical protein AGMMS50268_31660 [Spirochaetia bacterium]